MKRIIPILLLLVCTSISCKKDTLLSPYSTPVGPHVPSLNCSSIQISSAATAGAVFSGTVTVPFSGGNGFSYQSGNVIASTGVTGLNATLVPGILSSTGNLTYFITGKPSNSGAAIFPITFGNQSCSITVPVTNFLNSPPKVDLADSIDIYLTMDSCILNGSATDRENNIVEYQWTKISGPTMYHIVSPTALETKVLYLEPGAYQFEFKATDAYGLQGKDTVKVNAIRVGPNEKIFKGLEWDCPFGCTVVVDKFSSYVPASNSFQVFLKESNSSTWHLVKPLSQWEAGVKYVYEVGNDYLLVYTDDATGKVDIKIKF